MAIKGLRKEPELIRPPVEIQPPQEVETSYQWVRVKLGDYTNVRAAPTTSAKILYVMPRGTFVDVERSGKAWLKIKDPRFEGIGYITATILNNLKG